MIPSTATPEGNWFQTTHWSVVLNAGQVDPSAAHEALARLCKDYWPPLYTYVRSVGNSAMDAEDLTQAFFARLMEKNWLAQADPEKGRFRCFLLGALKNFLANEWRRSQAVKRGGGKAVVSLDDTAELSYAAATASDLTPEKLYQRRWALELFERALNRLRDQYSVLGKGTLYDALKDYLSVEVPDGVYAKLGAQLQMSPGAVAAAVHRLRQRYRELVREEIAQTVARPEDIEDEVRALIEALS